MSSQPMIRDPLIDEIRKIREAFAKKHGYDVKAIVRALQEEEVKSGRRTVAPRPTRRPNPKPRHAG